MDTITHPPVVHRSSNADADTDRSGTRTVSPSRDQSRAASVQAPSRVTVYRSGLHPAAFVRAACSGLVELVEVAA